MFGITEFIVKSLTDDLLALCVTGSFCISAVCQQSQNTLIAKFGKFIEFCYLTVNRRLIEFKITGMDYQSDRSMDRQCYRVGNTVIDTDKFYLKAAGMDLIAGFDDFAGIRADAVFF